MTAPDAHNRPPRGDAPVTAQEAGALDTWLESITSTSRRGGPVWPPAPDRSRRSANGHVDSETSLQATAEAFHARLARAEHDTEPDVPADAIWEKIMASTTSSSKAAELVSNGVARASRPMAQSPARTVPVWLSGSHWAVSAFMVVAVVVGIVALYGSFAGTPGPNDGPATNPNFAMASPGETVTTPEPDIDRWLVDPATVDCERDPAGWTDSSTWQTDRPTAVENYLPFAPATPGEGRALADRWWQLNADCAPTAEDPLITEDYGWMPTSPIGIPTADQIAIAQKISDALPMQDYMSYYILREPASTATPVTGPEAGSHLLLLPQDVVQLADGRTGGPLRIPIQTYDPANAITSLTEGLDVAATIFVVFEQVDGVWLLDEQFTVCVGECETVWADVATFENYPPTATPVASTPVSTTPSASTDWLQPVMASECDTAPRPLDEVGGLTQDPGQVVPREYTPTAGIEDRVAQNVAAAHRTWASCRAQGLIGERRAVESLRYIAEIQPHDALAYGNAATFEEWIDQSESMRAAFLDPAVASYRVESDAMPPYKCGSDPTETGVPGQVAYDVIQPQHLVQLPDGRVGGPVTSLVGSGFLQCLETHPPAIDPGYQATSIHIYAQDPTRDNRWALDEQFSLCVSGCDAFYDEVGFLSGDYAWPATPAAIPDAYLEPIRSEDCPVEKLTLDQYHEILAQPVESRSATYIPIAPAPSATAEGAATTARQWLACSEGSSAPQRAPLETTRYTQLTEFGFPWVSQPETTVENIAVIQYLSTLVFTGDPAAAEVYSGDETATVWSTTLIPDRMVALPDGRIGGPVLDLVPGTPGQSFSNLPFRLLPFVILVEYPNGPGTWLIDETLMLCVGTCDPYWSDPVQTLKDYHLVPQELDLATTGSTATPPATPAAATPAASAIQPITPDECDVAALSPEHVSAIAQGDGDGDVIARTYTPTSLADAALAGEIAASDRAWQSCYVYGTAGQRAALQSPRLTRDGPGEPLGSEMSREAVVANLDRFDATRELGEVMLTGDWQDYYLASDLVSEFSGDPVTGVVQALPELIPMAPLPGQAVLLDDGRVALPHTQFIPPDTYADALENGQDLMVWRIPVHILTQDPTQGDRWVVDETLTLCMGDCDLARTEIVDYNAYLDSLVASPEATPAATPQARQELPLT